MNELKIFENPVFGKVRVVEIGGDPWFVAKDVAEALGYVWAGSTTIRHIPNEWKGVKSVLTPSGMQEMLIISEHGLYFFLGRSDKEAALSFQKWMAGEVMPAIRKNGAYLTRVMYRPALCVKDFLNKWDECSHVFGIFLGLIAQCHDGIRAFGSYQRNGVFTP